MQPTSSTWANRSILRALCVSLLVISCQDRQTGENHPSDEMKSSNLYLVNIGFLDRQGIARQVRNISKFNPKVIGIDAFFLDEKELDEVLVESFSGVENLVMAGKLVYTSDGSGNRYLQKSHSKFLNNAEVGFVNLMFSEIPWKNLSQTILIDTLDSEKVLNFGVLVADLFDSKTAGSYLDGNQGIADIHYEGGREAYEIISTERALAEDQDFSFVEGKIVLFGFLGPGKEDMFVTPANPDGLEGEPDMYGVLVHANVISTILAE